MSNTQLRGRLSGRILRCFCGFDGFVDEVVHAVDCRVDADTYTRIETLTEYGRRIAAGSGLSINIEIVTVGKKLGGNGPIFAAGLKRLGADITYIGSVGKEGVDQVFSELAQGARLIGIAEPGRTDAMEFNDGKIIRSKLSTLSDVNWQNILTCVGLDAFVAYMDGADVISFNNWTMLPHMTQIWDGILNEAVPRMHTADMGQKVLFFDLADPEKRTRADILGAVERIGRFCGSGFHTVLGLNKKEACELAEVMGKTVPDYRGEPLKELAVYLYEQLHIDCLVIHPVDRGACITRRGYVEETGPYCPNPKLTTGAGDNFNAGFISAYAEGLDPRDCLMRGMGASGFYVRFCHSPNMEELDGFMKKWNGNQLDKAETI